MPKYKCNDCSHVFSGAEFSNTDWNTTPTLGSGPFDSPVDGGATPQDTPFPNSNYLPAGTGNGDAQPYSNIASSKKPFSKKDALLKKQATPSSRFWIAPDG